MPIYEYSCNKCHHYFEEIKSIKDYKKPGKCPKCGTKDTTKLMSQCASKIQWDRKRGFYNFGLPTKTPRHEGQPDCDKVEPFDPWK